MKLKLKLELKFKLIEQLNDDEPNLFLSPLGSNKLERFDPLNIQQIIDKGVIVQTR